MKLVFKFLFAHVVYHREYLNNTMHPDNPLHCLSLWSETAPYAEYVTTRYPWNKTRDTPGFTGLPIDVLYLEKIELLRSEIKQLKAELLEDNARLDLIS